MPPCAKQRDADGCSVSPGAAGPDAAAALVLPGEPLHEVSIHTHQLDQHPNFLLTLRARCRARPCEQRAQRGARSRTWRGSAWRAGWRCRARRCVSLRCASRAMAARGSRSRPPAAT